MSCRHHGCHGSHGCRGLRVISLLRFVSIKGNPQSCRFLQRLRNGEQPIFRLGDSGYHPFCKKQSFVQTLHISKLESLNPHADDSVILCTISTQTCVSHKSTTMDIIYLLNIYIIYIYYILCYMYSELICTVNKNTH